MTQPQTTLHQGLTSVSEVRAVHCWICRAHETTDTSVCSWDNS